MKVRIDLMRNFYRKGSIKLCNLFFQFTKKKKEVALTKGFRESIDRWYKMTLLWFIA